MHAIGIEQKRRTGNLGPSERTKPQAHLDEFAVDRHPLGFAAVRDEVAIETRTELDAGRQLRGQAEGKVEAGRVVVARNPRGVAVSGRAAGGVEKHPVNGREVYLGGVHVHDDALVERG